MNALRTAIATCAPDETFLTDTRDYLQKQHGLVPAGSFRADAVLTAVRAECPELLDDTPVYGRTGCIEATRSDAGDLVTDCFVLFADWLFYAVVDAETDRVLDTFGAPL